MEGLRFDHMVYLQTLLARTTGAIEDYENPLTREGHLAQLRRDRETIKRMIERHG